MKIVTLLVIISAYLYAGKTNYNCVVKESLVKLVVDTTWYGKPTTLSIVRNEKLKGIIPNIQTKMEYIQADYAYFETKKEDGSKVSVQIRKTAPFNAKFTEHETSINTTCSLVD